MDKKPRKKFRDTKVGQFLKEKTPKILAVVVDILPDSGALGVVKNLVNMAEDLTQEEKDNLIVEINEMLEVAKIELMIGTQLALVKLRLQSFIIETSCL